MAKTEAGRMGRGGPGAPAGGPEYWAGAGLWVLVLVGCSSSDGGIRPEPGGGTGGAPTSAANSSSTDGAGGSLESPHQNRTSDYLFSRLQGVFDSADQEAEGGPLVPKRLVGCALDANELGERVLYLERSDLDTPATPDRQFLVVVEGIEGLMGLAAVARMLVPLEPEQWIGHCESGSNAPPLDGVEARADCVFSAGLDDASHMVSMSSERTDAACFAASAFGETISAQLLLMGTGEVSWADAIWDADGSEAHDPPGSSDWYVMQRRTAP